MKAIILVGGYAKRFYPLTENTPKSLLPIVGKPIVHYIIEKLEGIARIDRIYLSTNQKFEPHFNNYIKLIDGFDKLEVVTEDSTTEENKLGAIGALNYLLDLKEIDDDLIIIAGDNLFDFCIRDMINDSEKTGLLTIGCYDCGDKSIVKNKFGCISLGEKNLITGFVEKPDYPETSIISTGIYVIPKDSLKYLKEYKAEKNNLDAPGFFMQWLIKKCEVNGYIFTGNWFDIGHFDQSNEAIKFFEKSGDNRG